MALSQVACEAALASILTDHSVTPDSTAAAANTLHALLIPADAQHHPASRHFTEAETALMFEWLARLSEPLQ